MKSLSQRTGPEARIYPFFFALVTALLFLPVALNAESVSDGDSSSSQAIQVAAYYFPHWHNARGDGEGGPGEWKSMKTAVPRFAGHQQPKIPLWGYEDESDPKVMAKKIDAAADHGVDAFIFDWYYHSKGYYKGRYLEKALDLGYLKAPNRSRVKFALMWANHSVGVDSGGELTPEEFTTVTDHIVKDYFLQPSYWKIDGKPYFSIYEVGTFVRGMGGIEKARTALEAFDAKARAAGLKGIHFNAIESQVRSTPPNDVSILKKMGFSSVTSYTWVHLVTFRDKPATDYDYFRDNYFKVYDREKAGYGLPYFPNVTMGWDPTSRLMPGQKYTAGGNYPDTAIIVNNTVERFHQALEEGRDRARLLPPGERVVTINSWNEWGEGSYLEPDVAHKMDYLNAVKDVFASRTRPDK